MCYNEHCVNEGLDKIYLYIFTLSEHGAKLGSEETRSVYELRQCG